jgi:hypothetical protein
MPRTATRSMSVFTPVVVAGSWAVGAPWWALCPLCVLGLVAASLTTVFPQDSADKLAWWTERWRAKQRRTGHCRKP